MKNLKINPFAILVCVLLSMAIPAFWYGAFAEPWMANNNLTEAFINQNFSPLPYGIAFIASMVTVYCMAWIFTKIPVTSAIQGAGMGLMLTIAFYFVTLVTQNAFSFQPFALSLIDGGANLMTGLVTGGILGAWRKYTVE